MFRIKKEDYNTVQFMPDYKSGENLYKKQKPAPAVESIGSKPQKARAKRRLIVALIIIVAVCVASWYVYSHYFTQEAKYLRAFDNGSYKSCTEIATANASSSSFKDEISDTVIKAADKTLSEYKSGDIKAQDAINQLNQYNTSSASMFDSHITENINAINTIEGVYETADRASTEAQSGDYENSLKDLQKAVSDAEANDLDIKDRVSRVLTDNMNGFKQYLFGRYSSVIRWSTDFAYIKDSAKFVTTYVNDADFTNFLNTVSQVENNEIRRGAASRQARQVVRNARAEAAGGTAAAAQPSASSAAASATAGNSAASGTSGTATQAGSRSSRNAGR